jgi:hypothetical protein
MQCCTQRSTEREQVGKDVSKKLFSLRDKKSKKQSPIEATKIPSISIEDCKD